MASETFKKRQKESARREKKLKKAARLLERRQEKAKTGAGLREQPLNTSEMKWPTS
jgi:hypothetical protein